MARLYLLLFLAQIVLAVVALISCLSAEESDIRGLPRIIWVIIILLFPIIGSIAWFLAGRPATATSQSGAWRPGSGFPESERPRKAVAPDDDPDFLRSLGEQREEERRRREQKKPDDEG